MNPAIERARRLVERMPRQSLGFFPTPIHKLERLSRELGIQLYLKRDDLTGVNLFGGNKVRKLEFLMGDAVAKGCRYVITYGASQSNHAMQTAATARRCGLEPILYLVTIVEPSPDDLRANLLLDQILGAQIHLVPMEGQSEEEAEARAFAMGAEECARLCAAGTPCYDIPMGGASPVGTVGFIGGWLELEEQLEQLGVRADYVVHATGTGGTMAGLAAGRKLAASDTRILSAAVSPKDDGYETRTAHLANQALELLGAEERVDPQELWVERGYFAPGYEIPSEGANDAIRRLARAEGILTDPVYSGKAFYCLLDQVEKGIIPQGSTVVFWHTGGATALFAEQAIIGDLSSR